MDLTPEKLAEINKLLRTFKQEADGYRKDFMASFSKLKDRDFVKNFKETAEEEKNISSFRFR